MTIIFLLIAFAIIFPFWVGALQVLGATRTDAWWEKLEKDYRETIDPHSPTTPVKASSFFNFDQLYRIVTERRLGFGRLYLNQGSYLAGTLVGLGIFGTFLGLSISLKDFPISAELETIRSSVEQLLRGMTTAFSTSLVGIGASIFYTHFVDNPIKAGIETEISERCNRFDDAYYLSADISVADQLQQSHEEFRKQTSSLSSFADTINAALERTLAELTEKQLKPMNDQMEHAVQEFIGVAEEIKVLAGKTQSSVIETVVADLKKGLEKLLGEFLGWFSEEAQSEMRQLLEGLESIRETLDAVPGKIEESMEKVSETVTVQSQLFAETVERANGQAERTNVALEQLATVSERFDHAGSSIGETLEIVQDVWQQMGSSVTEQREQIQGVLRDLSTTATSISESVSLMGDAVTSFSQTEQQINRIFTVLKESIASYSDTVERSLDGYLQSYTQETTDMLHRLAQTFETLREEIETVHVTDRERVDRVTQVFSDSAQSIASIKDILDTHITQSSHLNSLLSDYLGIMEEGYNKFDSSTDRVVEKLNDSVTAVAAAIEETLSTAVDGFNSQTLAVTEKVQEITEKLDERG